MKLLKRLARQNSKIEGYNLLEILVVLCIISIISHWSFMHYQSLTSQSRRHEAILALLALASALETYALTHDSYSHATLDNLNIAAFTSHQRYGLQIDLANDNHYQISASPNAQQHQWDIACDKLIYNSEGEKTISGRADPKRCWSIAS